MCVCVCVCEMAFCVEFENDESISCEMRGKAGQGK